MRPRPFLLLLAGFALALMAAGEADAKEPLWSYDTGNGVGSVAISADGEYIAAGSNDYKVYLFDKDSSTPLWSYTTGDNVLSVAISADGEYIAAGTFDDKVYLFGKDSSTPLWNYTTGDRVYSVAISADGVYIAAGSEDDKFYLFDKDNSTPLWSYTTGDNVLSVAISADGEYIAAGSSDDKVYLFEKDSSTPLWNYTTEQQWVYSVAISADGEYITAGSSDDKVYLFGKDSSTPLWSYTVGSYVWSVAISADGEYITAGSGYDSNYVHLFDKDSNTPLWSYKTGSRVRSVAISADGEYIAAGSDDDKVYLFDKNIPPTATIDSITPSSARFDAEVTFNGAGSDSDGTVVAYEWYSDIDGFLSDEEDFSITGFSAGTHTISFRVRDNNGDWSDWDIAGLEIYPNALPVATIDSITPQAARFDAEVTFSGSGADSDGTVVAYEWNSDIDGFLSDEEDFSITGLTVGNHTISFRVQDNDGEWSDWSNWSTAGLDIYPNALPVATIDSITPQAARFDAEVTFSGSGADSDGTVVAYEWNSDIDGFLSDEEDFSITGFTVGNRTISFRVQDNDGDWSSWSTAELYIYPNAPPVGTIDSIEPSPAEKGDEVTFNGTGSDSDGTIVAYLWESSIDGELSTDKDFSSSDLSLGHHTITFQVQDNDGDWNDATVTESLFVFAYPVAIAGDDVSTTPTVPVQFNGQGTDEDGTIAKYEWDFDGNGVYDWSSTENGRELNIYNNKGTYTAMLRVTDNDGFTDTDTVVITVTEKIIQIDDEGNVTVTDAGEDEEGIPAPSLAAAVAAVAVIALFRPRKP